MESIKNQAIEQLIFSVRGDQVMLDFHLALIYGVETKRLNEQVKRNSKRFPETFMYPLSQNEWDALQSQIAATSNQSQIATSSQKHRTKLPYAFTEQGVSMLSAVLNSDEAINASIQIMQAFVKMRKFLLNNASVFQRLDQLEIKQLKTDEKLELVFKALEAGQPKAAQGIFFDGQVFDAYVFVADLIKSAKKEIILIDNYVDESVLILLSKRKQGVDASIYSKTTSKALDLDLKKHNSQYPPINLHKLTNCQDRFLLVDQKHLYQIGASLKDLGKRLFAFSKMDDLTSLLLNQLKANA